ncbi:MAG: Fe-Mn family superoxide dismutase [Hyphomonadaceae bacterium]|nr:Fe-Mn family superoxide dismutase [Hyphomonadaceae bacterium]
MEIDRRTVIAAVAATGAALAVEACATAQQTPTSAAPANYQALPLPFDPKAIPGLSEKILVSHHDNNYVGAVNRLGAIEAEVAKLDINTAPGFVLNGLKREELIAMNSMILHEVYFSSLGASGGSPSSQLASQIKKDFGNEKTWRDQFVAMGKALGGGSGWVLLVWSPRAGKLINQWAFDHTMNIADGRVLLALDMYEHAYHMDFGARAAAYVDAFMGAISWTNADKMLAAALRA